MLVLHSLKVLNLNLMPKDIMIRSFNPIQLALANFEDAIDIEDLEIS